MRRAKESRGFARIGAARSEILERRALSRARSALYLFSGVTHRERERERERLREIDERFDSGVRLGSGYRRIRARTVADETIGPPLGRAL